MPATRLLVIDDDDLDRHAVRRALAVLGGRYEMLDARDGRLGIELAVSQRFDCILVDYNLPDINGLDLLVELHGRLGDATAIVMLTGSGNEAVAVEAMKRGAHDYLPKAQMGPDALARAVANAIEKCSLQRSLAKAREDLERLALFDPLTGLGNRNLFNIELARAIAMAQRKGASFTLLMMDLDKFKAVNDAFGHEAGDAILAAVGRRLRGMARAADAYFRLGGDEFTAVLDAGSDGTAVTRRIAAATAEPVRFGGHALRVTVSIGQSRFPVDGRTVQDLLRAADSAMYDTKSAASPHAPAGDAATRAAR